MGKILAMVVSYFWYHDGKEKPQTSSERCNNKEVKIVHDFAAPSTLQKLMASKVQSNF